MQKVIMIRYCDLAVSTKCLNSLFTEDLYFKSLSSHDSKKYLKTFKNKIVQIIIKHTQVHTNFFYFLVNFIKLNTINDLKII